MAQLPSRLRLLDSAPSPAEVAHFFFLWLRKIFLASVGDRLPEQHGAPPSRALRACEHTRHPEHSEGLRAAHRSQEAARCARDDGEQHTRLAISISLWYIHRIPLEARAMGQMRGQTAERRPGDAAAGYEKAELPVLSCLKVSPFPRRGEGARRAEGGCLNALGAPYSDAVLAAASPFRRWRATFPLRGKAHERAGPNSCAPILPYLPRSVSPHLSHSVSVSVSECLSVHVSKCLPGPPGNAHPRSVCSSRSSAAAAKARMLAIRSVLPVSMVSDFSAGPTTAMQACPAASP